ncbi:MAG: VanZ family protein [Bacteroidaceae bacterium]|nr:VanZ family protein [Bacteroidaceae bacterium]
MDYIKEHVFGLLTLILITVLSLMPAQEFPQVDISFADKWAHCIMYGFLTMILGIESIIADTVSRKGAECTACRMASACRIIAFVLFASLYGSIMELAQAYLTTSRNGDWMDVWANCFGALCAGICLLIMDRVIHRK